MWFFLIGIGAIALLFGSHANAAAAEPAPGPPGPPGLPPITPGVMMPPYEFVPGVPYRLALAMSGGDAVNPTLADAEADLEHSGFQIVTLSTDASPVPGYSAFIARVVPTVPVTDDGLPGVSPTGLHTLMYDVEVAPDTNLVTPVDQSLLGALGGLAPMLGA